MTLAIKAGLSSNVSPIPKRRQAATVNTWRTLVQDYDGEAMAAATFLRRALLDNPA